MDTNELYQKKAQTSKLMLWFAMISMVMMFAGLTSAFIVSSSRKDWLKDFEMPISFSISTILIVLSSFTFHYVIRLVKQNKNKLASQFLFFTLFLGIAFVFFQFRGFREIIDKGYFFTGSYSTVTTSFLYIVVMAHLFHLFAGLIALLVIIYNHYKQKYNSTQTAGIEIGALFWHFLDVLWILLFLFFYFY